MLQCYILFQIPTVGRLKLKKVVDWPKLSLQVLRMSTRSQCNNMENLLTMDLALTRSSLNLRRSYVQVNPDAIA